MKTRCLSVALLALALLLAVPPAALAKGASAATINGPGLGSPISLGGLGEPGMDTRLANLSDRAGLFAVMFGDGGPGQLSGERPAGDLGPRYTITYAIPDDHTTFPVVQDLYPYAPSGPVTYAHPGQRLWAGQRVAGGWFYGPATLLPMLVSLGLPARPPAGAAAPVAVSSDAAAQGPHGSAPAAAPSAGSGWLAGAGSLGGMLLLVVAALALRSARRRRVRG